MVRSETTLAGRLVQIRPRTETVQLSRGRTTLVSRYDGEIRAEEHRQGLYVYDTRVLGSHLWLMNGAKPEFSGGSNIEQNSWLGYSIQAPENCNDTPTGECDPLQQTLELRLTRRVGEGMHEGLCLTNHTQIATSVKLELRYAYEFVSEDEAKLGRKQHGDLKLDWSTPESGVWEQMADYYVEHRYSHQGDRGVAKLHRGMKLRIEGASSPPECEDGRIVFRVDLPPHGEWHVSLSWLAYVDGLLLPGPLEPEWNRRRGEFFESVAEFAAPGRDDLAATVQSVLRRAAVDLGDLRMFDLDSPGGITVAAGIPSYLELFGRDTEISAWQSGIISPEFLRGCLNVLSKMPARETDDWRDAQPGRIPHQVQTDPLSVLNFRPLGLYFGSVSSSFLFPIVIAELWRWTGDLDALRPYIDTALGALRWADTYCLDSTGFYRYQSHSEQGVKNQGWRDSNDAIVYPDGSQVDAPLGTCEMQGFVYAAKAQFSEILWRLGNRDIARRLLREAEELKKRFNEKFWMEEEGFFALAIDDKGELVRSIASDPGQCLLGGIVDEDKRKSVASRLMSADLFSGWGVRTLSAKHPAYNPFAYHRGTVWPITAANFVLAFGRYGFHAEMHELAKGLFEAAALFEYGRLPEVFGGHQRTSGTPFPGLYTRANWPQAWSASAPLATMQAMLGIYPYAPAGLLLLDPHLPEWLPEISVERMRVGRSVVSLRFVRRPDGNTDYSVTDLKGELDVVRCSTPWLRISGCAECIDDFISSIATRPTK